MLWQLKNALLAQLDRVTGYEPVGQGFESLAARHEKALKLNGFKAFLFCKKIFKFSFWLPFDYYEKFIIKLDKNAYIFILKLQSKY